jgi:hypothetical protein
MGPLLPAHSPDRFRKSQRAVTQSGEGDAALDPILVLAGKAVQLAPVDSAGSWRAELPDTMTLLRVKVAPNSISMPPPS